MKRLLAIVCFVAGGLAAELAHPVYCAWLSESRARVGPDGDPKERRTDDRQD